MTPTCNHQWHGKPCGGKTFRYWLPLKSRYSHATLRSNYSPSMKDAHCTKCGNPIKRTEK